LTYNVRVPFTFLWSIDGSFERRRWPPRAQTATAESEDSYPLELTRFDDERPGVQMQWVGKIDANGKFCLRVDWTHLRSGEFDS
jgi:hypothetical protein